MRLRVAGEGEAGIAGGPPGDLYVVIRVRPHPLFAREGRRPRCEVPIPFVQAALGAEIEVPTLEGRVTLRIPEGTQSGKVLRLRGQGAARRVAGGERGDQLRAASSSRCRAGSPTSQRELLEKFAERAQHGGVAGDEGLPRQAPGPVRLRTRRSACARRRCCLLAACAGIERETSRPEEQRAYAEALRVAAREPRARRRRARGLPAASTRGACSPTTPRSSLAELALRLGQARATQSASSTGCCASTRTAIRATARGSRSRSSSARGDPARARSTARASASRTSAPSERREAQRLLADLAADAGDPVGSAALARRSRGRSEPRGERREGAGGDRRRDGGAPARALAATADALGRRPIAAHVWLAEAERALGANDREAAERALERAQKLPLVPADADQLVEVESRLAAKPSASALALVSSASPFEDAPADPFVATAGLETTLGVALPLSGSVAGYARTRSKASCSRPACSTPEPCAARASRRDPRHARSAGRGGAGGRGARGRAWPGGDRRAAPAGGIGGRGPGGRGRRRAAPRARAPRGARARQARRAARRHFAASRGRAAGRARDPRPGAAALRHPLSRGRLRTSAPRRLLGRRRSARWRGGGGGELSRRGHRLRGADPAHDRLRACCRPARPRRSPSARRC